MGFWRKKLLAIAVTGSSVLAEGEPIELPPMPVLNEVRASDVIQPYEVYDRRFCFLTPDPFLCKECLRQDMQFVRLLRFQEDGSLERIYGCLPYRRPYVQ